MMEHLIQKDQHARLAALDPTQSFIVQAPAGSGKTEILIQRLLVLLQTVNHPEEILAITFTKKAANEMRARVMKALKQAAQEEEPKAAHAKQTWQLAKKVLERDALQQWHLMDNPNQLRIQTIDSLCGNLTKQLPLLSHFGSPPNITENATALYEEAVQEVLAHVEENFSWSNDIAKLLLHLDNDLNKLHDLLVSLLAKRDLWYAYIQLDMNDHEIKKRLEQQLALVINHHLTNLTDTFPKSLIPDLLSIARFAADQLIQSQQTSPLTTCRDLFHLPGTTAGAVTQWLGLSQLVLTKSFSWRKRIDGDIGFPALNQIKNPDEKALHQHYRERLTELIATLSKEEKLRLCLMELAYLPAHCYSENEWEILKALLHVLKILAAQLRVTFARTGKIDFTENAQAALYALGNADHPTDLALALDYHIQHILIDEFQDTSYSQYLLLEKLISGWDGSDGRTLFVVGDPMQSIYRFREAEVGLFIRMSQRGISQLMLTPLTLAVNFRSAEKIVAWNNHHFKAIFPNFNDIATGAVTYSESIAHHKENTDTDLHVTGLLNATDTQQANEIVTLIQHLLKEHPQEKIAILVRARSHLAAITPALKNAHIPYHAIDIDPLASKQCIQDIFSLTCALLHPADRIAWLALLRAPWCGLSLNDLFIIAGNDRHSILWEQLQRNEILQQLSAAGYARLQRIIPILQSKMAARERMPLRVWIESTWLLLGGPACLAETSDYHDIQAYFQLLEEFSEKQPIFSIDQLRDEMQRLYAAWQSENSLVQIMTIHTAKGLEFDTVILPHLERKLPHDEKTLLSWMEQPLPNDQVALLLAPIHAVGETKNATYDYIARQQKIKADYEIERLLYVATTRAKRKLYLFFNTTETAENEYKVEQGSFLEKIWPLLKNQTANILKSSVVEDEAHTSSSNRMLIRLPLTWQNPLAEIENATANAHQQSAGFKLYDLKPKLIGTLLHRLFQQLAEVGIAWWQTQTKTTQHQYLIRQLNQIGITAENHPAAIAFIEKAINNLITDTRGQWILAPHQEAISEFAITAVIDQQPENLIIDRTFIDETNTRWIIDYKTVEPTTNNLAAFLDQEEAKYHDQMQKYYRAMQLLDPRPIRMGLYFPLVQGWREMMPLEKTHQPNQKHELFG